MKRRELLKQAGALAISLPAAGLVNLDSPGRGKDLLVTLSGPLAYILQDRTVQVWAPLIGDEFQYPHQSWTATNSNEQILNSVHSPTPPQYEVSIPIKPPRQPKLKGAKILAAKSTSQNPLFLLSLPVPHEIYGTGATSIRFNAQQPFSVFATGSMFLYKNVPLDQVVIKVNDPSSHGTPPNFFEPCFTNDEGLPLAFLNFYLQRVKRDRNQDHEQAIAAWKQVITMLPEMKADFNDISFEGGFNPALCPAQNLAKSKNAAAAPGNLQNGPGQNCELPGILVTPPGKS